MKIKYKNRNQIWIHKYKWVACLSNIDKNLLWSGLGLQHKLHNYKQQWEANHLYNAEKQVLALTLPE